MKKYLLPLPFTGGLVFLAWLYPRAFGRLGLNASLSTLIGLSFKTGMFIFQAPRMTFSMYAKQHERGHYQVGSTTLSSPAARAGGIRFTPLLIILPFGVVFV